MGRPEGTNKPNKKHSAKRSRGRGAEKFTLTKHSKYLKYTHIVVMLFFAYMCFLVVPGIKKYSKEADGTTLVSVYVNGTLVGTVDDTSQIDGIVANARKRIAKDETGLVLMKADVVLRGSTEVFGVINSADEIEDNIYNLLKDTGVYAKESAYEIKINKYTVKLKTAEEVIQLLEAVKNQYDSDNAYSVELMLDPKRELDVLTTEVQKNEEVITEDEQKQETLPIAGMAQKFEQFFVEANEYEEVKFVQGLKSINFSEKVEVVRTYVNPEEISTLEEAISEVTKKTEKSVTYTVQPGDTVSEVAKKNGISVAQLVEMNPDTLKNEDTMLRVDDVLKVTSPEPELSVLRVEESYIEENYNAEVQYIDNDEWYTTESKTLQQPQEGFRKIFADVTYKNDTKISTTIVYENIVSEAIPKIVERGTKTPPTYVYPISGGRMSSTFGKRKAPKKGASTYHKGIDWAVPTGTPIRAACGGVVTRAGWGSGYGYCVYIRHPDGKETRYGHCSKVLVKSGQSVKQGEKIALSGNTGVSTGPHLHFEILVGGSQVNPLKYLQ